MFRVHPKTSMASALPLSISALTRSQSVRIYPLLYLQYSVPYCCIKMYTVRIPAMANSKFNSSIILKPKKKKLKRREKKQEKVFVNILLFEQRFAFAVYFERFSLFEGYFSYSFDAFCVFLFFTITIKDSKFKLVEEK